MSENIKDQLVQDTLDESRRLEDFLNNNLLLKFCDLHNINRDHSKLHLKQEIVAKRGFFFNVKKRYALHVVNQEGREVDEIDFKGIVNRRSDYPSYTKECILKLLDMVLIEDPIPFDKIYSYIGEIREKMVQLCLKGDSSIAKPVSYAKDDSEYKLNPSHIMGMKLWNDLEYEYFVHGTKGYQYRFFGVDVSKCPDKILKNLHLITKKNNYIVVPYEEDGLPEYYNIDLDYCVKFCWDDRVNEILKPVLKRVNKERSKFDEIELSNW